MKPFLDGFRAMLPITTGVVPFGAVMGTVSVDAQLSFFETVTMNILMLSGAAQLAKIEFVSEVIHSLFDHRSKLRCDGGQ